MRDARPDQYAYCHGDRYAANFHHDKNTNEHKDRHKHTYGNVYTNSHLDPYPDIYRVCRARHGHDNGHARVLSLVGSGSISDHRFQPYGDFT
jgi:hypothetical protein